MSTMISVRANGVELGVETFGRDADPLVLLAGVPTMLSWPDPGTALDDLQFERSRL